MTNLNKLIERRQGEVKATLEPSIANGMFAEGIRQFVYEISDDEINDVITQTVERTVEAVVKKIEKYRESANDHTEPNEVEIVCDDLIHSLRTELLGNDNIK